MNVPTNPPVETANSRPQKRRGFTLLELLVSLTVLSLLLVLVFEMVDKTRVTWTTAEARVSQFREARNAFELVTRRVSQAVLNNYYNYDNISAPKDYIRYSELHFLCGPVEKLGISNVGIGHAIFFQAPLGYTVENSSYNFSSFLNSCGYFIQYENDENDKPSFVKEIAPDRQRFRLMEFRPPAEEMNVYETLQGKYGSPNFSNAKSGDENRIAPDYYYDTRAWQSGALNDAVRYQKNQLPPLVEVTMIAVSERSMIRYQQINGESQPSWALDSFSNSNQSSYEDDIEAITTKLTLDKVDYRLFKETVSIRAANWSDSSLDL
jgi:prepilin-type N-terminal cleavage/methylation domain-containing protein